MTFPGQLSILSLLRTPLSDFVNTYRCIYNELFAQTTFKSDCLSPVGQAESAKNSRQNRRGFIVFVHRQVSPCSINFFCIRALSTMPHGRGVDAFYGRATLHGNGDNRDDRSSSCATARNTWYTSTQVDQPNPPRSSFLQSAVRDQETQMARLGRNDNRASSYCYSGDRRPSLDGWENEPVQKIKFGVYTIDELEVCPDQQFCELDVPSMATSDSSSMESDVQWNGSDDGTFDHFYQPHSTAEYVPHHTTSRSQDIEPRARSSRHRNAQVEPIKKGQVKQEKTIEIAPGQFLRLRGADETWNAVVHDFYRPCMCICCDITIFCIQDASLVLCPICRVVNPLEDVEHSSPDSCDGGVGLGFTMDDLSKWQRELGHY